MSKHYPGPYQYVPDRIRYIIQAGPTVKDKHIAMVSCDMPEDQAIATAKLLSAAPELLAALKDLVTEIRAYSSPECDQEGEIGAAELKAADIAIAKAEGN